MDYFSTPTLIIAGVVGYCVCAVFNYVFFTFLVRFFPDFKPRSNYHQDFADCVVDTGHFMRITLTSLSAFGTCLLGLFLVAAPIFWMITQAGKALNRIFRLESSFNA